MEKIYNFAMANKLKSALMLLLFPATFMGIIFMFIASTFLDGFVFCLFLEFFILSLGSAITLVIVAATDKLKKND